MSNSISRLLSIASPPLAAENSPRLERYNAIASARLTADLSAFLAQHNGFYAFDSALHVYSDATTMHGIGLFDWNAPNGWIGEYGGLADGMLFFAQDLFGGQFALRHDGIVSFDPETGATEFVAESIEAWASCILDDWRLLTAQPIAHAWQLANGPLPAGQRLLPKTPFVMGGEYSVENLYALDASEGMSIRGSVAVQIRDLPDGTQIKWRVTD